VQTLYSGTGEGNGEKVALEARPEVTVDRRFGSYVVWQTVRGLWAATTGKARSPTVLQFDWILVSWRNVQNLHIKSAY